MAETALLRVGVSGSAHSDPTRACTPRGLAIASDGCHDVPMCRHRWT
jgi:hypothetical protein